MLYVFLSFRSAFVGLAFCKHSSSDGIRDDGESRFFLYSPGYFLALVVASLLLSFPGNGNGDDGVDAFKEVDFQSLASDESAQIGADVGAMMVFQLVDGIAGLGVAAVVDECGAPLDGDAPPEHLCHLVFVGVAPGHGEGEVLEAVNAKHLFRAQQSVVADGTIAGQEQVDDFP